MFVTLHLVDLDAETRAQMLAELEADVAAGAVYYSSRVSPAGRRVYTDLLRQAFRNGTCASLAMALSAPGILNGVESAVRKGKRYSKRVPQTAPETMAEGEFNRYYLRGICRSVIAVGGRTVLVYRARSSRVPRTESEALIGRQIDAEALLEDLRAHAGVDTALGLPPGPNSGLSARHPI